MPEKRGNSMMEATVLSHLTLTDGIRRNHTLLACLHFSADGLGSPLRSCYAPAENLEIHRPPRTINRSNQGESSCNHSKVPHSLSRFWQSLLDFIGSLHLSQQWRRRSFRQSKSTLLSRAREAIRCRTIRCRKTQ